MTRQQMLMRAKHLCDVSRENLRKRSNELKQLRRKANDPHLYCSLDRAITEAEVRQRDALEELGKAYCLLYETVFCEISPYLFDKLETVAEAKDGGRYRFIDAGRQ